MRPGALQKFKKKFMSDAHPETSFNTSLNINILLLLLQRKSCFFNHLITHRCPITCVLIENEESKQKNNLQS